MMLREKRACLGLPLSKPVRMEGIAAFTLLGVLRLAFQSIALNIVVGRSTHVVALMKGEEKLTCLLLPELNISS